MYLSIYLSLSLPVYISVHLSVYLPVYLAILLSVSPSLSKRSCTSCSLYPTLKKKCFATCNIWLNWIFFLLSLSLLVLFALTWLHLSMSPKFDIKTSKLPWILLIFLVAFVQRCWVSDSIKHIKHVLGVVIHANPSPIEMDSWNLRVWSHNSSIKKTSKVEVVDPSLE